MTAVLIECASAWLDWGLTVGLQTSVLIAILFAVDLLLLRRYAQASTRYWLWMLVPIRFLLPVHFSLPTGVGNVAPVMAVTSPATPATTSSQATAVVVEGMAALGSRGVDADLLKGSAGLLWVAVVALLLGLLLHRMVRARRVLARSVSGDAEMGALQQECRRQLDLRRDVQLRVSDDVHSPALCGLLRPRIIVPRAISAELTREELRAVLLHELAHVRRGDAWVDFLQSLLQAVFFCHPLLWLANRRIRSLREQATDESVLAALQGPASTYSATLVRVARLVGPAPKRTVPLLGIVETDGSLSGRVRYMLHRPVPTTVRLGVAGAALLLLMGAVLLPMARSQAPARPAPTDDPPTTVTAPPAPKEDSRTVRRTGEALTPGITGQVFDGDDDDDGDDDGAAPASMTAGQRTMATHEVRFIEMPGADMERLLKLLGGARTVPNRAPGREKEPVLLVVAESMGVPGEAPEGRSGQGFTRRAQGDRAEWSHRDSADVDTPGGVPGAEGGHG